MSEHPTDEALAAWLATGRPARVERHLDACDGCLARVDALSEIDAGVRSELVTVTAPPADLGPRTAVGVRGRLAAQEALSVVVELFTLPWRTLDALVDDARLRAGVVPSGPEDDEDAGDGRGAT